MKYQSNLSELICKAQALVKSLLNEKDASLRHAAPGLRQEQCGELSNYLNSAILLVRSKKSKAKPESPSTGLTFNQLRKANRERLPLFKNCHGEQAHSKADGSDWTPAQWLQAVTGELGEYANFRKKFERGDISFEDFKRYAAQELADVQTYLDILAMRCLDHVDRLKENSFGATYLHVDKDGINLGEATVDKFNEVSKRVGCTVFLQDGTIPMPPPFIKYQAPLPTQQPKRDPESGFLSRNQVSPPTPWKPNPSAYGKLSFPPTPGPAPSLKQPQRLWPEGLVVTASGIGFGSAWYSHERITGKTAAELNEKRAGVTGNAYATWVHNTRGTYSEIESGGSDKVHLDINDFGVPGSAFSRWATGQVWSSKNEVKQAEKAWNAALAFYSKQIEGS